MRYHQCRCGAVVEHGQRCERCNPPALRTDTNQGTACQRGYDRQWRNLRERKVAMNPLCEDCEKQGKIQPTEEVHHIVPISVRRELRLVMSNLRSLCRECHSKYMRSG